MSYKMLPEKQDPDAPLGLTGFLSDIRLDYKPVTFTRYEPMERKY
jgi:succinate dehydrogenase / fumarate reductase flavoprotein subunit